ncbi:hypothetical protein GCG54_00006862 [Colletotrichum gloeosporioides]|uniref:Zn(2)-C6 fungal-type domain-containing protein n=1 Tax=Colletotrichum gloeosporioides TaxID=474922 RepID=A0A8H4CQD5_COLGL|nr:uncharacterized protein GCG54_00006862 [Colletotrichum gloeosporioides]KAF3808243.1 hypothetical protein GCG54_00006862 [Colletotrichum gloeosporioides]
MTSELRSSQRTVKSCTFCARRKVKCDKNLPCRNCRVRGQAESCAAELVRVKGRPPSAEDAQPTYAELLDENRALREELASLKADPVQRPARPGRCIRLHKIDDLENSLYNRLRSHSRELTVKRNEDVVLPSKQLSQSILTHGANWVPWVNCSLNPAEFQEAHDKFFTELGEAGFHENSDPAWLGLYFAYLTAGLVCEAASGVSVLFLTLPEAESIGVSKDQLEQYRANWFDASVFFLHAADFIRNPRLINVRTIVLLGGSYVHFGELNMYYVLWSCAARICHSLGLDQNMNGGMSLESQYQSRLFWSLIANDWLNLPLGHSCIDELEFAVDQPLELDDVEVSLGVNLEGFTPALRPVQHLIALCKLASVLRRFQTRLLNVLDEPGISAIVIEANDQLTAVITQLPAHLRSPRGSVAFHAVCGSEEEWVRWQRNNIRLLCNYYRIVINRTIQEDKAGDRAQYTTAIKRCLDAAHEIHDIIIEMDSDPPRHFIW